MTSPEQPTQDNLSSAEPFVLTQGQKLGGIFVLSQELASSPGRTVWLAQDEVLGKDVSLHFIPEKVRQDKRAMGDLRQEVKRTRQLIHPSILRVYDLVEEAGWAAISMDRFQGTSLDRLLADKKEGFFEPGDIKGWLLQVTQTLGDAHRIAVVHRSLSPENIILENDGRILLANFGISRVLQDSLGRIRAKGEQETHLAYLSPQQLDGEPPTPADDIYSLGATIYQLLTGEPPFVGTELVPAIRKAAPQTMMDRRAKLNRRGGTILPVWEKAVGTCLAKNAADRPANAAEVATKLALTSKSATSDLAPVAAGPQSASPKPASAGSGLAQKNRAPGVAATAASAVAATQLGQSKGSATPGQATESAKALAKAPEKPVKSTVPPVTEPIAAEPSESSAKPTADPNGAGVETNGVPDIYPSLYPKRSRGPGATIALLGAIAVIGGLIYVYQQNLGSSAQSSGAGENASTDGIPAPVAPPVTETGAVPSGNQNSAGSEPLSDGALEVTPAPSREPAVAHPPTEPPSLPPPVPVVPSVTSGSENSAGAAMAKAASGSPAGEPSLPIGDVPTVPVSSTPPKSPEEARAAVTAAEQALASLKQYQQTAEAEIAKLDQSVTDKKKAAEPVFKAVTELSNQRKAKEEAAQAAAQAELQAKQAAEEKARMAEDARQALADFEAINKEKLAARDKADAELKELQSQAEGTRRISSETAQKIASVESQRQAAAKALAKFDEETRAAKEAAEKESQMQAQKLAEQKAQQRKQIEKEIEDMKRAFEEKMRALETLKNSAGEPAPAATSPAGPLPEKPAAAQPAPPTPVNPVTTENPAAAQSPDLLAMRSVPPANAGSTPPKPEETTAPKGEENSLGMKFVPVGDVSFCIWPTRVKDFEVFAKETGFKGTAWRAPGFKQGADHPVVNVSWNDAMQFCKWLTERERKKGTMPPSQAYRLPTDLEWSRGVGLPEESGKTPEARDMGVADVFPWGGQWPPPPNAGNYTGEETGSDVAIKGYDDGFAWTSPVGSFPPNRLGLYDMGGNVWQWCMDSWNNDSKSKVLRGASWYNGALKLSLLSSCRYRANPDGGTDNYGFRVVRASDSSRANKR